MRNIAAAVIGFQSSSGRHGSGHRLEWRDPPRPRHMVAQYISVPGPAILDREIASVDPSQLPQAIFERDHARLRLWVASDKTHQHADPPHLLRLRVRPERQCGCRGDEQRDELARRYRGYRNAELLGYRRHDKQEDCEIECVKRPPEPCGNPSQPLILGRFFPPSNRQIRSTGSYRHCISSLALRRSKLGNLCLVPTTSPVCGCREPCIGLTCFLSSALYEQEGGDPAG